MKTHKWSEIKRKNPFHHSYKAKIYIFDHVTCSHGHTCIISPATVLQQVPCNKYVFTTGELTFMFAAFGATRDDVSRTLGDSLCSFYEFYSFSFAEEELEEFTYLQEQVKNFHARVTYMDRDESTTTETDNGDID